MSRHIGVVQFPGTNCEQDSIDTIKNLGGQAEILWHGSDTVGSVEAIVIPGGFAHGDYLRCGAIARFSPIMTAISRFANSGGVVLGICNGFQVLTETGLLPGALQKNVGLKFLCQMESLIVDSTSSAIGKSFKSGEQLQIPINHFEGNYVCSPEVMCELEANGQIFLRYESNPNGSIGSIAGISNKEGNIGGMMPHPERATSVLLGSMDGNRILSALFEGNVKNNS